MSPERFEHLGGKSILFIESDNLAGRMRELAFERVGFSRVVIFGEVPKNLREEMEREGVEMAVIHARVGDEETIIEAFRAGMKIMIVGKAQSITEEFEKMQKRFIVEGIPVINKGSTNFDKRVFVKLNELCGGSEE